MNKFLALLICLFITGTTECIAQLCDIKVETIEQCGSDPNGPVNEFDKRPWALFLFEVEDANQKDINGSPILPVEDKYVLRPYEDDEIYNAYVASWTNGAVKGITLHHPDFNNCQIIFKDYLGEQSLKGGDIYKIKLQVPSASYIEAVKAYYNLDFATAKELFSTIAEDPVSGSEEKAVANTRLETIDSLIIFKADAEKFERNALNTTDAKERDRNMYRARLTYAKIFKRTGLINAEVKAEEIKNKLFADTNPTLPQFEDANNIANQGNLNALSASAYLDGNDTRAMGNEAVTYTYTDKKGKESTAKSALLIIKTPFRDPSVKSKISTAPIHAEDGSIFMYVKTIDTNGPITQTDEIFTLTPPEYTSYGSKSITLKDLGIDCLEPQKVYNVTIAAPSLIMEMANNNLSDLNFETARNLYKNNFEDATEYEFAQNCLSFLDNNRVKEAIKVIEKESTPFKEYDMEWSRIITGNKKFSNLEERNRALTNINSKIETSAKQLSQAYYNIYEIAKNSGIELEQAFQAYLDYQRTIDGVRNIPLIIVFKEAKKAKDNLYTISSELTDQPTVMLKFSGKNNKVIPFYNDKKRGIIPRIKVKDSRINVTLNNQISELFVKGEGKMEILPIENNAKDKNGKKCINYDKAEYEIKDLKVDGYGIVKIEVVLSSK